MQMNVRLIYLKNGHVQMDIIQIHGVIVVVVLMIQYVMTQMQINGITVAP
jgi:hypothetical protein